MIEERRKFFRVKLRKLTSVVIQEGAYELIFEEGNHEDAVSLKFIPTNTDYLKQFVEAIKA